MFNRTIAIGISVDDRDISMSRGNTLHLGHLLGRRQMRTFSEARDTPVSN